MRLQQLLVYGICLQVILVSASANAQRKYAHQLSLVNENDNYAFTYTDRYYTNGMMLRYVRAKKSSAQEVKKLFTAELGQQIFTPYKFNLGYFNFMDRPFTGYLYLKALHTRFYNSGSLVQWGAVAGIIGEKAFGKEVQRWHHQTFDLKIPHGWETQLRTGIGLNFEGRVVQPLLSLGGPKFGFALHGTGQAQVGTLFVQGSTGMLLRLGAVQPAAHSAAFDARVNAQQHSKEWYLYYEPQLNAHAYNATLQGTLTQRSRHYYTTTPKSFTLQQRVGLVYAPNHFVANIGFSHKTKEAATMRSNENWGTVSMGYRW